MEHHSVKIGPEATMQDKYKHLKELAKKDEIGPDEDKITKLKKYIKKCYNKGYTRFMIKKILVKNGLKEETIERAFEELILM